MESELAPLRMEADHPSADLIDKKFKEDVRVHKPADEMIQRQSSMVFDPESRLLPKSTLLTPTVSYQAQKPESFVEDLEYDGQLWFHIDQDKVWKPQSHDDQSDPYRMLITQVNQLQADLCPKEKTVFLDEGGIDEAILVQSLPKNLHSNPNLKKGPVKKDQIVMSSCGNMMLNWDTTSITIIKTIETGKPSNRSVCLELRQILEQELSQLKEAVAKQEARNPNDLQYDQKVLYPHRHHSFVNAASAAITRIEKYLSSAATRLIERIYNVAFTQDSAQLIIITSVCVLVYSLKEFKADCVYVYPADHSPVRQDQFRWVKHTSIHKRDYTGMTSIQPVSTDDVYFQIGSKMHQLDFHMRPYNIFSPLWSYTLKGVDQPQQKGKEGSTSPENLKYTIVLSPEVFVQIYEVKGQDYDQSDAYYNTTFLYLDGLKPDPKEEPLEIYPFDLHQKGTVAKKDFCIACIDTRQLNDRENKLMVFESVSKQFLRLSLADPTRFVAEPLSLTFQHLSPQDLPNPTALTTSPDLNTLFVDYAGEHWKVFGLDKDNNKNMLSYRELMCSTSSSVSRQNVLAPDLSYVLSVFNQRYSLFPLDLPIDVRTRSSTMPKKLDGDKSFENVAIVGGRWNIVMKDDSIAISGSSIFRPWIVIHCYQMVESYQNGGKEVLPKNHYLSYKFIQGKGCQENPDIFRVIYSASSIGKGSKSVKPVVFTIDCKAGKFLKLDCKSEIEDFTVAHFSSRGKAAVFERKSGCNLSWFADEDLIDVKVLCPEGCKPILLDDRKLFVIGYLEQDKAKLKVKVYSLESKSSPLLLGELEHHNPVKTEDLRGCKWSQDEGTVIFFSLSSICVVNIKGFLEAHQKEKIHIQGGVLGSKTHLISSIHEQGLGLNQNSFEISNNGNWIAVIRRSDQQGFLIDKNCKSSLPIGICGDPQSRIPFSFELEGKLVVFNVKYDEADWFELPSTEHPDLVTALGSIALPRGFEAFSILKESDSLMIAGTIVAAPKDLVTLRINTSKRNLGLGPCRSILMRYITADSQDNQLNYAATLQKTLTIVNPVHLQSWSAFSMILYLLNHPGLLEQVFVDEGLETLMLRHPLLTLFYKYPKKESQRSVLKLFDIFNTKSKRYPRISSSEFRSLLQCEDARLLTKGLGAELLTTILCARIDVEQVSSELISDSRTVIPYQTVDGQYLEDKILQTRAGEVGATTETVNQNGLGQLGVQNHKSKTKRERVKEAIRPLLEDHAQNFSDYLPVQNLVPLDLRFGSDYSLLFFRTIETLDDAHLQKYLSGFIYYKWDQIYPAALVYAVLFWTQYTFIYVHLGYYVEQSWQAILLIVLASVFLAFELKCYLSAPRRYIRDPWNYWDVAIQVLSIVAVMSVNGKSLGETSLGLNYLRAITVQVFGVRALTMLRVFRPTRYMITMVLEVFLDVLPFIPILVLIMLVWALIWSLLPTLSSPPAAPASFYSALITPINIVFGNAPSGDFSPVQLAVLVGSCVILSLILMNFLIALIGSTFSRIKDQRGLYDLRELFPLLRDFDAFARNLGLGREGNAYFVGLLAGQSESEDIPVFTRSLANKVEVGVQQALSELKQSLIKTGSGLRDIIKREGQLAIDKIQTQADLYHKNSGHGSHKKGGQNLQSQIKAIEESLKSLLATHNKPQN